MDEYYQVVQALPQWLARPLGQLPSKDAETVHELRLRLGCAPQFTVRGCSCTPAQLAPELNALQTLQLTPLQMEEILFTLCGGSVHTHQTEIAQGYVTLENGCRAGLGGRFLQNPEQGTVLQELTSVNLRIAREKTVPLPPELTTALQGHFIGMLLVGEPGSGKTTLLRSIARELVRQHKILSVIDERRELFAGNSTGEVLDVLAGLPKGQAVQMALRTLSPQVILLDELGGLDEVTALEQGLFSGVDFIATLHAATPEEATMRPQVKYLMERGAVRVLVWLTGRQAPGCIGGGAVSMSPLRWMSVCCFVVCGWCAGDSFHQQAQAHLEALRKTLNLLETLHQEISFRRSDLNLLCRKLIQDGQLPPETVSLQTLEPFPSLTLEERTRFSECFSGLGRLEAEQECRRLELYQAQFQAALQEGEAAARTQSMLSHKLGLAAGLAAAILLG